MYIFSYTYPYVSVEEPSGDIYEIYSLLKKVSCVRVRVCVAGEKRKKEEYIYEGQKRSAQSLMSLFSRHL